VKYYEEVKDKLEMREEQNKADDILRRAKAM